MKEHEKQRKEYQIFIKKKNMKSKEKNTKGKDGKKNWLTKQKRE